MKSARPAPFSPLTFAFVTTAICATANFVSACSGAKAGDVGFDVEDAGHEAGVTTTRPSPTGAIATLHADYNLPAGGAISFVGWRERAPTFVDRLVVGVPSASALPALQ